MEKIIKPKLIFENNIAVLKYEAVSSTEAINGCEYFKEKVLEAEELNFKKLELETQLAEINRQLLINKGEQLDLEKNGYCPIDYQKTILVGALTKTEITHRPICKHKEK